MRAAGITSRDDARELRHAYIKEVTSGRAAETKELSDADARLVIRSLKGGKIAAGDVAHAAGTHGRHGHHDGRRQTLIGAPQTALLAVLIGRLGWNRERLDAFIARQLGSGRQIRTMADFNRVAWGMKSLIRQADRRAQLGCTKSQFSATVVPRPE